MQIDEERRISHCKSNKKWRLKNPELVYKQKQRRYAKYCGDPNKRYKRWTQEERDMVMAHEISYSQLSKKIGRSYNSILAMKSYMKKKLKLQQKQNTKGK